MSNQPQGATHRSVTGFVTKLVGGADGSTYGFINDEIFFPQANVSGGPASVGDQVFAECEYSAHLPIKWNAKSIQILSKGGGGAHQQRPDQQDLMNQQQQMNMTNPVAVTYQQHRQQRQQRQVMDVDKQADNKQQGTDLTSKLLEQTTQSGDFFANNARPFSQQQDNNIQPFPDQPMGPANFTYTSQLGSAFVQNQFVPPPFMTQQSLLSQQPLLPNNNNNNQQMQSNNSNNQGNNQRQNQHNKGGRFNNQGDKNDRQNNRRNRNDNKFDRPKSGDRDSGQQNNRSSKSNGSRDRSTGRNSKREDPPSRPSPPTHSSARSTTSVSSDRGHKSRRHYEIHNVPKTQIMTNMNAYNMKQRCPSSVHVPSDLKEIIVNRHFRLDIKNTPKPLRFTIEQSKPDAPAIKEETGKEKVENKSDTDEVAKPQDNIEAEQSIAKEDQNEVKPTAVDTPSVQTDSKNDEIKMEKPLAPATGKTEIKLSHKYCVKVILISLPELTSIYRTVFGENLDSYTSESKPSRLDETISLLCNKGTNNGYSLIGGKFDSTADGFIEGQVNEFERQGLQPDLIATCKRVVLDQTGLDLSGCKSWTLLSTFMYNNKSDYFSSKASIEYSYIYMPQIWTMLSDKFDKTILKQECGEDESAGAILTDGAEETGQVSMDTATARNIDCAPQVDMNDVVASNDPTDPVALDLLPVPENLAELKVTDLKAELDKRNIKYKNGAKKAELIALLQESLPQDIVPEEIAGINVEVQLDDVKREINLNKGEGDEEDANNSTVATLGDESQLEEGEVEADPEDSPVQDGDATLEEENLDSMGKRKAFDDSEVIAGEPDAKKVCTGESDSQKQKRVELIQESFVVHSRNDQQLSLVTLYEATQSSRYDQFELSVASNLLKESLIQHLSEYILTTLVEDSLQRHAGSTLSTNIGCGTSSNSSSQEMASSDTNNNSSSTKSAFKSPSSVTDHKINLKELGVDRYINLAFSYFDSSHMGYIQIDDLNKLFNNTGLTISKRGLISLVGDSEKFSYKTLPDLSPKLSPTYVYRFPDQFSRLPGMSSDVSSAVKTIGKMIEYKGVTYDLEKLIQQVNDAETLRVSLVDRFNYAIENSDKQAEEIHVLEVSQKSLAKAIKAQNDEICNLKRERDSIKKKYDNVRKGIKGTITSLSDLVKDDK